MMNKEALEKVKDIIVREFNSMDANALKEEDEIMNDISSCKNLNSKLMLRVFLYMRLVERSYLSRALSSILGSINKEIKDD